MEMLRELGIHLSRCITNEIEWLGVMVFLYHITDFITAFYALHLYT